MNKDNITSIEMKETFTKKQMSFVLYNYRDDDDNQCELFQVYADGFKVYEKDYGTDVKTFDDYVHDYYNISYLQHYFPPTNTSVS